MLDNEGRRPSPCSTTRNGEKWSSAPEWKAVERGGPEGSSLQCHQDEMSDLVQPHPRTPTAQSKSPKRARKHSSTCPKCRPLRPGELVPNLVGRAQAPFSTLSGRPRGRWRCGNKMAVSLAGVCRTTHVARSSVLASTLGERQDLGPEIVCVWQGRGSGTRDERTMTCMQLLFLSPSPVHLARPIRPLASFCFAPGPVHRVPRHWPALWICCHTSDDMLECGSPAAAHWSPVEVVG